MSFIICMFTFSFLTIGIFFFGLRIHNYSHVKHTISELGETGSAFEKQVSLGLFLPVGILLAILALIERHNIYTTGISAALAVGYIVAAFFPCDPGSPSSGSIKQTVHNTGGFIEYAGCIYFIVRAGEQDIQLWNISLKTIG